MPNKPYVVALTGGIGSGKSTVADIFASHGVRVVDADAIAHDLTAAGGAAMPAIEAVFGDRLVDRDGALDRAAMRELAFGDDAKRVALEVILHPMIRIQTEAALLAAQSPYAIWMVPLLFESGGDGHARAQRVLVVDCPEPMQVRRVMARSKLNEEQVQAIMARQVSRQIRLQYADDVVDNSGELENLEQPISRLHANYLEYSGGFER